MDASVTSVKDEYLPKLRRNLEENILDFWHPRSVDEKYGGFILSYDRSGEFAGTNQKMIVTQSRMVWLFSRLALEGYGDGEYLEAANSGYEFLRDAMWDDDHGGFYWEVSRDGEVTKPNKHMYGQSFGLYGLSEYYRVTGDEEAKNYAIELFSLMETEAKDDRYGGYVEYFESDWSPIESGKTYLEEIEPDWSAKESGDSVLDPTLKLMNTHLHLLEAFTTFHEAVETANSGFRLQELLHILTNTVVRKDPSVCTDKYTRRWEPRLDSDEFRIASYGHDLENIWLTMDACEALDLPMTLFSELYRELFTYSLKYGYDSECGGFYFFGPLSEPATNQIKAWWVQAESMVSALKMFRNTQNPEYLSVFCETFDFVDEYLVDWEHGEWHSGVDDELRPVGRKGAPYKGAYHNGRAMLECINELEQL